MSSGFAPHVQNSVAQKRDIDDSMLQRIDGLAVKLQGGLSSSLRESGFETLEVRVKDGFGDKDAKIEQHSLHQMGDSGEARQQSNSSQRLWVTNFDTVRKITVRSLPKCGKVSQ